MWQVILYSGVFVTCVRFLFCWQVAHPLMYWSIQAFCKGQKYCRCTRLIVSSLPGCPAPQWLCNCLRIFLLRASSGGTTSRPPSSLHSVACGPVLSVMGMVFSHCLIVSLYSCWAVTMSCSIIPGSPASKTFRNASGGKSDVIFGSSRSSSWCILNSASAGPLSLPGTWTILKL